MEDLVSVVLPVYNRENTIKRAIDSVLVQTYANIELIIVDDASTDHTVDIIKSYEDDRINLICLRKRGGANKARNIGISNARGEFVAFQDSDDEWLSNKLAVQIAFMQAQGNLVCFCPYYLHQDENISIIPNDYETNEKYHSNLADILKSYNVVGTPTLVLKREVLSLLGGGAVFDETLPRFQEYELLLRLVQILDVGYIAEPLVNVYRIAQCISKNERHLYEAVAGILEKHLNFLEIKSFLNSHIIQDAEYKDTSCMLQGIEKIQEIIDTEGIDLKAEVITYLSEKLKNKNLILEKLYQSTISSLRNRKFVIYGVGTIAKKFYKKVNSLGIRPEGFIVSSLKPEEPKAVNGILVYTAEDYPKRDILVIVCTSLIYQNDILDNLVRMEYSNICIYHDL